MGGGRGVSALALLLQRGDSGIKTQPISGPSRDKILRVEALKRTDQEQGLGLHCPSLTPSIALNTLGS